MPTRGLINPELLTDIADAIREKNGTSAGMTPAQMAEAISNLELSEAIKQALLNCFAHVAWIDDQGQTYYDALEDALYPTAPPAELLSISAVFEQGQTVIYDTDSLDDLKPMLTVTAHYSDSTSAVVTTYTLSGTLTVGTSIITVSYGGKTATFSVTVTAGSHNVYADDLENWFKSTSPNAEISYSDGVISLKSKNSTGATGYSTYVFDRAKTLWSAVEGKTLRCRIKLRSTDWQGAWVTGSNSIAVGLAIYKNATITSGSDRQRNLNIDLNSTPPTSEYQWYEITFVANVSNFTSGSGTPTSSSTFGFFVFDASQNTIEISDAEIYEVAT